MVPCAVRRPAVVVRKDQAVFDHSQKGGQIFAVFERRLP